MSSLKGFVAKGLSSLGLAVENDKGGFVVSDQVDGRPLTVRIDENERIVRLEGVLCHPVDDFSPELSKAMDWLNRTRSGVCFAYSEAQRALIVSTVWTSPSRDPASNQLHLLVALLQDACGRDGPQLERVAEGEATWEEVKDGDQGSAAEAAAAGPPPASGGARASRSTSRLADQAADFEPPTRRFDAPGEEQWPDGDPTTRPVGRGDADGPRVTTRFTSNADGSADDDFPVEQAQDRGTGRRRVEPGAAPKPEPREREASPEEEAPPAEAPRPSRTALAMAIHRLEHDAPKKVDMTEGSRSGGARFFKALLILCVIGAALWGIYTYFLQPVYPHLLDDAIAVVFPEEKKVDEATARREQAKGIDLFIIEMEDPLPEPEAHERWVHTALTQLGDAAGGEIEKYIARTPNPDGRSRAHALWVARGFGQTQPAQLRLLRGLIGAGRHEDKLDRVVPLLVNEVRLHPPADAVLIDMVSWAKGAAWVTAVELLGRPGEGAQERAAAKVRSDALAKHLDKDDAAFTVLRAMVRTGFGPPDAAARLVAGRGITWARGEGKTMLVEFIVANPDSITPLLRAEDEEVKLCAVELLISASTSGAADTLIEKAMRDPSLRVRLRATLGVAQIGSPDSAWPLALALSRRNAEPAFVDELRRAIGKLPATECAAKLREHLDQKLPPSDRYFAVVALQHVQNGGGVGAISEALRDPDVTVRRAAAAALEQLSRVDGNRRALSNGLAAYREVARSDRDPTVKQTATRLYKALTGLDP